MQSAIQTTRVSVSQLWVGRVLSGLAILFLIFDGAMKLVLPPPVVQASAHLGYPNDVTTGIGVVLLICVLLYAIPRTALVGALLLTAYLGGAVASGVRVGGGLVSAIFPIIFAVVVWAGLFLRDARLQTLFRYTIGW